MALSSNRVITLFRNKSVFFTLKATYAKKINVPAITKGRGGIGGTPMKKIILPVETDPSKLVNFVCGSNLLANEGADISLKKDEEYPEWLWKLRVSERPDLDKLDPNTLEYWKRRHKLTLERNNRLARTAMLERFPVNMKDRLEKLRALRFRALAGYHYDPGSE